MPEEHTNLRTDARKRILLVYTELLEYRVPFFSALGEQYALTVTHSGSPMTRNNSGFREIVLPRFRIGRFHYQYGLRRLIRSGDFDTVVYFMDIAWIGTLGAFLFPVGSANRVVWGLWRTGRIGPDWVRIHIAKLADFSIFYSNGAAQDFVRCGLSSDRLSVATNTFRVDCPARNESSRRDSVLVVGSFNVRKQNDVTLAAFVRVAQRLPTSVRLVFVGAGHEHARIQALAEASEFKDRIEFHRASHNEEALREYYDHAICSVSFGQAGLSVLQSFAYGVPFVTRRDAISGGEIENIEDGVNGCLCEANQASLESVLTRLLCNPNYAAELGRNALSHYINKASVHHMVGGFVDAIEHSRG